MLSSFACSPAIVPDQNSIPKIHYTLIVSHYQTIFSHEDGYRVNTAKCGWRQIFNLLYYQQFFCLMKYFLFLRLKFLELCREYEAFYTHF